MPRGRAPAACRHPDGGLPGRDYPRRPGRRRRPGTHLGHLLHVPVEPAPQRPRPGNHRRPDCSAILFQEQPRTAGHGLAAADLDDLRWEQRFRELAVEFTPIREAEFGYHLNFRDPDGIALELAVSKADFAAAMELVKTAELTTVQIQEYARQMLAALADG